MSRKVCRSYIFVQQQQQFHQFHQFQFLSTLYHFSLFADESDIDDADESIEEDYSDDAEGKPNRHATDQIHCSNANALSSPTDIDDDDENGEVPSLPHKHNDQLTDEISNDRLANNSASHELPSSPATCKKLVRNCFRKCAQRLKLFLISIRNSH